MYLIIKDPKSGTVRIEYEHEWLPEVTTIFIDGLEHAWSYLYNRWTPAVMGKETAEATAKSIAIKENLIYTPQIEY